MPFLINLNYYTEWYYTVWYGRVFIYKNAYKYTTIKRTD